MEEHNMARNAMEEALTEQTEQTEEVGEETAAADARKDRAER